MRWVRRKNGQTTLEYTAVIACLVGALLGIQFYVKRAVQGRLREAAEQIGEQYEPGATESEFVTTVERGITTEIIPDEPVTIEDGMTILKGKATLTIETIHTDKTERVGYEVVGP